MAQKLLLNMRKINRLLQRVGTDVLSIEEVCTVLGDVVEGNVMIIDQDGIILGMNNDFGVNPLIKDGEFCKNAKDLISATLDVKENISVREFLMDDTIPASIKATLVPVLSSVKKLGTVIILNNEKETTVKDLIVIEYISTIVGIEMNAIIKEKKEKEERVLATVKSAISTLSYSEMTAISSIFEHLAGEEGLLVASKIADEVGITRSVIVNALRKLESAGVIESRSLGMKGTYIKVTNPYLIDEIKKVS